MAPASSSPDGGAVIRKRWTKADKAAYRAKRDAPALRITASDFPAELLRVPRQDWSTVSGYQRRPHAYPNAPKLHVEILQAARRASVAWAAGRWREIDDEGSALVVLDKVMQLNEYMRTRTSSETSPTGKATTPDLPFAFVTYFENWKRRLAMLTDWMYDKVSGNTLG